MAGSPAGQARRKALLMLPTKVLCVVLVYRFTLFWLIYFIV